MIVYLLNWLQLLTILGCCVLAWFKGGVAERIGALCLFSATLVETALRGLLPPGIGQSWVNMGGEALLALGFLVLALYHARVWIGCAMVFQGLLLTNYALHWGGSSGLTYLIYYMVGACLSILVPASLAVGVLTNWRARKDGRRDLDVGGQAIRLQAAS
jgi:hypothetical protein